MKYAAFALFLLASMPALAQSQAQMRGFTGSPTVGAQQPPPVFTSTPGTNGTAWPKGCVLFCEGWMFDYGVKPNDYHHFVLSKQGKPPHDKEDWAPTIDAARTIADARYAKVPKQ